MLIVITGDGKGKTTAAIGQTIRALGHGKRVFFAQFIKSDTYPSGEDEILRSTFKDKLTFFKGGLGFVGIMGDTLPFSEHQAAAERTLAACEDAARSGTYDLIVLDEANVALALKLITPKALTDFLDIVPKSCDVVLTGRYAIEEIRDRADFLTDCNEVKHPFHHNVAAKQGIEF